METQMKIPFAKPSFTKAERENIGWRVDCILDSTSGKMMSNGECCRELEEKVSKMSGADHAIACSSCTQGLMIALGGAGVSLLAKGNSPVIGATASFTWYSTAIAINAQGSSLQYFDIDYDNWCVKRYPAFPKGAYALAVDTFGTQFTPESKIPLFFDRAHSLGQKFRKLGIASVLSFSPSKLITAGEGGMILTNKEKYAKAYINARDKISRMTETNAAIALEGLKKVPEMLEWKKETYDLYRKAFPDCQFQAGESNHQVIGMLLDTHALREQVLARTADKVELKAYYEPLHTMTSGKWRLPVTDDVAKRIVCLPSWYKCPREDIVEIVRGAME